MKKLLLPVMLLSALSYQADAQTKRVLLYDYTGVNCQYCTGGTKVIEDLLVTDAATFIPIQFHVGNYTPQSSPLRYDNNGHTAEDIDDFSKPSGYPSGTVDMVKYGSNANLGMGRGDWQPAYNARKGVTAPASISIMNRVKTGEGAYEAEIVVEFTGTHDKNVAIQAFILEDSIKAENGLEQSNYSGGPHSGESPLTWAKHQYVHNNVLRSSTLGPNIWGEPVKKEDIEAGKKIVKKISWTNDAAWADKNLRVVAYVANHDGTDREVLNAEVISISAFSAAGIEQNVEPVEILSAFPNPANLGDVINVEFNINKSQMVTMNVYNMAGQVVATPYQSRDVQGGHTIQWKTALDNIAAGTYIVEVATEEGRQTQRVVLQ